VPTVVQMTITAEAEVIKAEDIPQEPVEEEEG
jgi:hypothetical protein